MLYGVGKLPAVRVLLRRENHGFGAVHLVYTVYGAVELHHVLILFDVEREEIGLNGGVRHHAHQHNSGTLVVNVLTIDTPEARRGSLHHING